MMSGLAYKILIALSIAGVFAFQRAAGVHATESARVAVGYASSLALCAAVVELGCPILGRRLLKNQPSVDTIKPWHAYAVLTALLVLNAYSGETASFLGLMRRPPPTNPLAVLIGFGIVMLLWVGRRGYTTGSLAVTLVGLVVGTRLLVLWIWPFRRIDGDMLATINRALDELARGGFPYIDFPPPMPYPPVTLLAYWPAKAFGLDLRYTNLALDAVTTVATIYLARLYATRNRSDSLASEDSAPVIGQLLLPCFMLHPVWIHYSVNSHYAPCLLLIMVLGFAVLFENFTIQALALGIAVGSNQMLGACGPILFAYWAGRVGPRRAAKLALLAATVFLLVIAPFLFWEPRQFIEIAFLSRNLFSDELMAGRFTLLPLASKIIPHASLVGSSAFLAIASWAAYRSRRSSTAVAAMASGLCAVLLFQPVSFTHYYLPVVVLASVVPVSSPAAVKHQYSLKLLNRQFRRGERAGSSVATTGGRRGVNRLIQGSRGRRAAAR